MIIVLQYKYNSNEQNNLKSQMHIIATSYFACVQSKHINYILIKTDKNIAGAF